MGEINNKEMEISASTHRRYVTIKIPNYDRGANFIKLEQKQE